MALQAIHDKLEDIPEQYRDLYTEKNSKWELTGITGVKTQADVDRVHISLVKERDEHKATKAKLEVWGELDHEEVQKKIDRFPELEAAAAGKLDDAKIDEMANQRADRVLNTKLAPLERQVTGLTKERDTLLASNETLTGEKRTRIIHDTVRKQLVEKKVIPEAHEDVFMLAERVFEIREEDGAVVTRDQVGATPGVGAEIWLSEMQPKRPHWWPPSEGGGGPGGGPGGGAGGNPWTHDNWNMTEQGKIVKENGSRAEQLAKSAGTEVGGLKPSPPK